MPSENENFTYAGELMKNLIDRLLPNGFLPDGKKDYYKMTAGWEEIAGTELAMHVFPRDIEKNSLILEADHPGWSQKILLKQGSILRKIQKKYSQLEIRRIRVFVGDGRRNNT